MRDYDPATDRHIIEKAVRDANAINGPLLTDIRKAFAKHGIRWPEDFSNDSSEYAALIDREITEVSARQMWEVFRDDEKLHGPAGYNQCWTYIHRISTGNSVSWMLRHEGYRIVPVQKP